MNIEKKLLKYLDQSIKDSSNQEIYDALLCAVQDLAKDKEEKEGKI